MANRNKGLINSRHLDLVHLHMRTSISNNRIVRSSRGQTLVIAIMVMFILSVVAAVFIALVARNLFRSERFSNVDVVAQIAEAGIRYADQMLTSSEDGADWRPVPDNHGVITPGNPFTGVEPVPDTGDDDGDGKPNWQEMRDSYPDFKWTRAYWPTELPTGSAPGTGYAGPSGGFTTFHTGEGRFLLRVSYNPDPRDPFSKYIKIESIGRWGVFDNEDPTTWRPYAQSNLRREITAYKPIGITDYLRFITNKGNRSMDFPLGCPGYDVNMGRAEPSDSARNNWFRGGPIRVNGNLVWYGNSVNLYLRGALPIGAPAGSTSDLIPIDAVEVAGEIKVSDPNLKVWLTRMDTDGNRIDSNPIQLFPSDSASFTTASGFYRDGSDLTDTSRAARGVKRIEPPLIDQPDLTKSINRYQLLTLYSGERVLTTVSGRRRWLNLAQYGWGRGVYISNNRDKQDESETLVGGCTQRADWLKPNSPLSTYWKGPFYVPPAAVIILHPNDTDGDGQADFTIIRSDTTSSGAKFVWRDAWGEVREDWGGTVTMPYPDPNRGRVIYKRRLDGTFDMSQKKVFDGNGVIYAEGNIRIRGMLPPGMQLTVVSNETIYIDGNLLKYRNWQTPADDAGGNLDPWRGADNTCGLALLARENICVNTTQFFSPLNSLSAENVGSDSNDGQPPFHVKVTNSPDTQLKCAFDFGPWESENGSANPPNDWILYLRHRGDHGPSYINAWLNPTSALPDWGILYLNTAWTLPDGASHTPVTRLLSHVWGVGDPDFNFSGMGIGSRAACDAFPLSDPDINARLVTAPGSMNLLQIGLDQTTYTRENDGISRIAVQPMDIRIEAILYAQEGSFFVIPGDWFNPDPSDVPGNPRVGVRPMFPYFGQPLDCRIIIDGAIAENMPAAISDVEEWMAKWGNIPERYGSSNVRTAHPGEGFTVLYDDHAGWPYSDLRRVPKPTKPIRTDKFGRILPMAPKLPVSSSLIYFGDVM